MLDKIKNFILKIDRFLFEKYGSNKSIKFLENIKEAQLIFSYLNAIGEETKVRFVGGCVRKSLCGDYVDDIDLATSLEPHEVKKKLTQNGITVIDTGILHGTVTAILNKKKFEITTLRKDVATDGRHANVEFTTDWNRDGLRRDFTINAIYADIDGRIFDPLNGVSDLKNGRIKFIGQAKDRIQEDYLRILRYFRFFIQYSKNEHDQDIILSIKQNINGLNKISNERIFNELKKILSLKNLYNLFSNSKSQEIFLNIFPQFKYYQRLKKINDFDQKMKDRYDVILILAILIIDHSKDYEYFCYKHKVSKNIKNRFINIFKNFEYLKSKKFYSKNNIKKQIYFTNKYYVKDLILFSLFINNKIEIADVKKLIDFVDVYEIPQFPISGEYLKMYGYESGEALGKKLKSLEEEWIKNNFFLDKKVLEKSLEKK